MNDHEQKLILVRLSAELTTKARGTRKRFTRKLVENVRDALRTTGAGFRVESQWTRLFVRTGAEDAERILARVPGISSFSVVEARCAADLQEIVRVGVELFAERVVGRSYAVRAKRTGSHSFSSHEVQCELGGALNRDARVDLGDPDVEINVEIRDQQAYFFSARTPGIGGLPLGVEGRAVCLLSGGFDSAVAAWLMLKRGVELDYVFCNLAGEAYERSVVEVGRILAGDWSFGTRPRLHVVDFGPAVDDLRSKVPPKYWQLVLKRLMYRAASGVATSTGAAAIITGEAIGQVSSQTLVNLAALDSAAEQVVFRPLIGFDKTEIIDRSREIGTFDVSSTVREYCAISPASPVTHASRAAAEAEEAKLDLAILAEAIADRHTVDLVGLSSAEMAQRYLYTDDLPSDAVVIDVREEDDWEKWHYPGAVRRDSWELAGKLESLDPDRTYVLYCDAGLQAAFLAEQMQRKGLDAYAFRGGTRALRQSAPADAVG